MLCISLSPGFAYNIQEKRVDRSHEWDSKKIINKLNSLADNKYYLEEVEKKLIENTEGLEVDIRTEQDKDIEWELDKKYFLDYELNMKTFTLKDTGKHVELWLSNDLSYSDKDLRNPDSVSDEQVKRMKAYFEEVVYSSFGAEDSIPEFHNGENSWLVKEGSLPKDYYAVKPSESRLIILIDNIKDEQYYNENHSEFIPGYYWNLLKKYIDRDIIIINSRDWDRILESTYLPTLKDMFSRLLVDNKKVN
jgi:hypothetical protein